ncbi:MAG: HD domain-containing protein [Treponema sp.]|nr:HD domain-containing protein [Treponema sp.]
MLGVETSLVAFAEKISSLESLGGARERILQILGMARESAPGAALILLDLGMDADTVVAALLLAVFRDRLLPHEVAEKAGQEAALLVQGVKKIDGLKTNVKTSFEAENVRNMLFALTGDVRVILIKLAEKLHAMRVLDSSPDEGRKDAARECLDIYAPLANRLGVSRIKDEMEDLSLKFLNREAYRQIKSVVAQKREQRGIFLELAMEAVAGEAKKAGLAIEVKSRAKHFYSVYMKMRKRGKPADEIRDLSGMRIICDSMENCYTLLGIIHRLWRPVNGSFKDYVAKPKPNGYQSLHTSVLIDDGSGAEEGAGEEGRLLEIQIRTAEMHHVAENGVASHWLYKKSPLGSPARPSEIDVANRLKGWKQGPSASGLWLEGIKRELFGKWVYVFTPQGKVIKLAAGATPIDFAYHVHTAVGERCVGAKAGGSIIPLSSRLENAQVVEILTSPSARPSPNWLQVVKTSKARHRIRAWLEKNDESFLAEKAAAEKKKPAAESQDAATEPDAPPVLQMVAQPLSSAMRVRIEDEKNLMIRFARCCNPVTGDPIIGYVSRGRGIIIHRRNCASIARSPEFEERKIEAEWESPGSALVKRFRIEAKLSANLFSEIEGAIRKWQGHLIEGRVEETAENRLSGIFTMQLTQAGDLKAVMKNIRGIPGLLAIQPID